MPNLTISLHAHACLEFRLDDFSLLCDPWISGYAFFGAWRHYPEPKVKAADLKPNALWISHEHSDHFHPQTLLEFDKNIPVFIPAFANGRLEKRLKNLGFKNIQSIAFGIRTKIHKDCYITIYEPASLWNDSQGLFEFQGFRILNINDAGINHRIHKIVGQVDCICAAFSPGASGYPATYTHLNKEQKIEIYEKSRVATLDMLSEACKLYGAKYFIPFASHFILNHPKHIKYMKIVRKNTIYDVMQRFLREDAEVIALLAGDSWRVGDRILRSERDKNLYKPDEIYENIKQNFDKQAFLEYYPDKNVYIFNKEVVMEYFLGLNKIPEMIFCEDLSVTIIPDSKNELTFSFEIKNGRLFFVQDEILEFANLTMQIPSEILMYICKNNESWDEATIGYWCKFSRNPDIYHTEFWRILQTPYYMKNQAYILQQKSDKISTESNVADVLETLGDMGAKILSRYGLYCLDCVRATMENIGQACAMHGVCSVRMKRMIKELNIHAGELKKVSL